MQLGRPRGRPDDGVRQRDFAEGRVDKIYVYIFYATNLNRKRVHYILVGYGQTATVRIVFRTKVSARKYVSSFSCALKVYRKSRSLFNFFPGFRCAGLPTD